ncbi:hypothetical protein BIW11_12931 [Tropilaelaps mercedesae]|uniref:Uncharacterized protein n=1 Tax=Tropilaelaps mercedesae TaxID=418985 RepID=A0A1V9X4I8_9ACAR|nr:hypothetical protein BIW11_12931 [Tropilaelaps mercedesae]
MSLSFFCPWGRIILAATVVPVCVGTKLPIDLDFVTYCCYDKCGTMNSPLWLSSPGLNKTDGSRETLRITSAGDVSVLNNRSDDEMCLITVAADQWSTATMNLSFYLHGSLDPTEVIVVDSQLISPKSVGVTDDRKSKDVFLQSGTTGVALRRKRSTRLAAAAIYYTVDSYSIRSEHQISIAVPVKHIESNGVHIVLASFAVDKGSSGALTDKGNQHGAGRLAEDTLCEESVSFVDRGSPKIKRNFRDKV